jgi:hypothetical protein
VVNRTLLDSWGFWVGLIFLTFCLHEGIALATVGTPATLTAWVRAGTKRQPILIFGLGIMVGAAAFHFWATGDCG